MVGNLILKRIYNWGDETLTQAWKANPYKIQDENII
jgi:hypothetical protein